MACTPAWSRGGCTPVLPVENQGNCAGPTGGTKTAGVPVFVPEVQNEGDLIWRDEDFTVIQADDDGSPFLFDNV
jgi:hypothetical protein